MNEAGKELLVERINTPKIYEDIIKNIGALVSKGEEILGSKVEGIGISGPGCISPISGNIKGSNTVVLNGKPFVADLEKQLGKKFKYENDANCMALSEYVDGSAQGKNIVIGLILGTGVGSGIVINGQVVSGKNNIAGEWGHSPLAEPTLEEVKDMPDCYCGKKGCIETYLSGPGFAKDFKKHTGIDIKAQEIMHLANQGDKDAVSAVKRYKDRLARSLAAIYYNTLDPDAVIFAGGLGEAMAKDINSSKEKRKEFADMVNKYLFSSEYLEIEVTEPVHGDSSGARGAAYLFK